MNSVKCEYDYVCEQDNSRVHLCRMFGVDPGPDVHLGSVSYFSWHYQMALYTIYCHSPEGDTAATLVEFALSEHRLPCLLCRHLNWVILMCWFAVFTICPKCGGWHWKGRWSSTSSCRTVRRRRRGWWSGSVWLSPRTLARISSCVWCSLSGMRWLNLQLWFLTTLIRIFSRRSILSPSWWFDPNCATWARWLTLLTARAFNQL